MNTRKTQNINHWWPRTWANNCSRSSRTTRPKTAGPSQEPSTLVLSTQTHSSVVMLVILSPTTTSRNSSTQSLKAAISASKWTDPWSTPPILTVARSKPNSQKAPSTRSFQQESDAPETFRCSLSTPLVPKKPESKSSNLWKRLSRNSLKIWPENSSDWTPWLKKKDKNSLMPTTFSEEETKCKPPQVIMPIGLLEEEFSCQMTRNSWCGSTKVTIWESFLWRQVETFSLCLTDSQRPWESLKPQSRRLQTPKQLSCLTQSLVWSPVAHRIWVLVWEVQSTFCYQNLSKRSDSRRLTKSQEQWVAKQEAQLENTQRSSTESTSATGEDLVSQNTDWLKIWWSAPMSLQRWKTKHDLAKDL